MTSAYRRDHITSVRNDEFEALSLDARSIIIVAASSFEAMIATEGEAPSEGERTALRRAMARFIIDSGIASARDWI